MTPLNQQVESIFHDPYPNVEYVVHIHSKIINIATSQLFTPAPEIVNDVLQEDLPDNPLPSLPAPVNLAHTANHHRQAMHPADPTDLDFELAVPDGFLHQDIRVCDNRHLISATAMMQLLSTAKKLYMDATFKVVSDPFCQLFSIHAFIKHDDCKAGSTHICDDVWQKNKGLQKNAESSEIPPT